MAVQQQSDQEKLGYSTIFVALDGCEHQDYVLQKAAEFARNYHAELVIGHVIDASALETASTYPADILHGLEEGFKSSIAKQVEDLKADKDIQSVRVLIRAGRIRETLKEDMLDIVTPDLIICGARGLSSIKYALLGSISTFLVRYPKCDTLVIK